MNSDSKSVADGPLRTVLEQAGVTSLAELASKPPEEVIRLLDRLTIPPSEALLGALVLNGVQELHAATQHLDRGTTRLLGLTRALVLLAGLTLAAAIITLIVAG